MTTRKPREFWIGSGVYSYTVGHEFEFLSAITFNPKEGIHSQNRLGEYRTAQGEPWIHVREVLPDDEVELLKAKLAKAVEALDKIANTQDVAEIEMP